MTNAYYEIVSHEGDYRNIFDKYLFLKIFEPIIEYFEDVDTATKVIKFIVYGFSLESTKLTVTGDRRKELVAIFNELEIDKKLYKEVVLLENGIILSCSQKWLIYQDNAQLEYLFTLEQAYIQQQTASISPLKKSDGVNIDYDQKQKCIEHMRELRKWIKEAQAELIQSNAKMKEAYKDVGVDNTKKSQGKGIESYMKEHPNGNS